MMSLSSVATWWVIVGLLDGPPSGSWRAQMASDGILYSVDPRNDFGMVDKAKATAAVRNLIRKHLCLEWHGHDHADINHRSVATAADAIVEKLWPLQDEDELAGIFHKAFSHPDAVDHSAEVVGRPKMIRTKGGWYVLGEDGMRFNLVCANRDPKDAP